MGLDEISRRLGDIAPTATTDVPALGVRVHVATDVAPPAPVIFEPMLYLVFQGAKRILLSDREISYGPGELVTTAAHIPALAEVVAASDRFPYRALEIPFDQQLVTALIAELGELPSSPAESVAVNPLPRSVLDPVSRLLELAHDPDAARVLAAGVKREIWYRILTGPNGGAFVELTRTHSALGLVHELTQWMHEHLHEPLDVGRAATHANMSVTSLYRLFKAATGTSPGSYHKRLRLMEARRRVVERSDTVGRIAAAVGYASPSQFTRDYRRAFGTSPTADF
ncbi:AraC family transcriptional regulator [Cryptosporangium arvum]|uniref:AraC family transcriptional regulator n=1 Tax=Cryptosporangium arvum TaxID=80871 RepID=UPI0004B13077|nr:AraC family transcriptional regulator [Cryptosporangium arvum]